MLSGSQPASDEELARGAQAGSLSDFEELVTRHEGRIYSFLCNCCRDRSQAREVTQIVFVTAFRYLNRYDPAYAFSTWLFTIARREFIDMRRARRPKAQPPVHEVADAIDPSVLLARREDRENIWGSARRLLSDDQFTALWLRYEEDLNIREIARAMGRTQTSVKVLLFRARQTLIQAWKEAPQEAELASGVLAARMPAVGETTASETKWNSPKRESPAL